MNFHRVREVWRSQAREFSRDFGAMFLSFIFPLFFAVMLIGGAVIQPSYGLEIGIVDEHETKGARKLVETLSSEQIQVRSLSRVEGDRDLQHGEIAGLLIFPDGDVSVPGQTIEILAESRYRPFLEMMMGAARDRLLRGESTAATAYDYRINTNVRVANSELNFLFPGVLALALLQLGMFATATPLLRAREAGTLRHLMLTPLTMRELIAAQVGFRFAIALLQIVLLLATGMFVLDLGIQAWVGVFGISILGTLMLICIGYAFAGMAQNLESGMAYIMIANFAMIFCGNIFWDPQSETVLWYLAHGIPVSYLADLFRQVIGDTPGLWPMWVDLTALLGWTALALVVAARAFRIDTRSDDKNRRRSE